MEEYCGWTEDAKYGSRPEPHFNFMPTPNFPNKANVLKFNTDPYGSSESSRIDGTATSSFVSWDSKITTVNAILGGVKKFVKKKMRDEGLYEEFISIVQVSQRASLVMLFLLHDFLHFTHLIRSLFTARIRSSFPHSQGREYQILPSKHRHSE